MAKVHDEASNVTADEGEVHIDGPDGVAVAMTPEAAADTSDRLLEGSSQAMGQQLEKRRLADEKAARDLEE